MKDLRTLLKKKTEAFGIRPRPKDLVVFLEKETGLSLQGRTVARFKGATFSLGARGSLYTELFIQRERLEKSLKAAYPAIGNLVFRSTHV